MGLDGYRLPWPTSVLLIFFEWPHFFGLASFQRRTASVRFVRSQVEKRGACIDGEPSGKAGICEVGRHRSGAVELADRPSICRGQGRDGGARAVEEGRERSPTPAP